MRAFMAALAAAGLVAVLLLCMADGSDAVATVTFHYEDGGALYRQTATGEPLNTAGIEATVALGPWYDKDGRQWDPAEPIMGDLELWLTIPAPQPLPPDPQPVPMGGNGGQGGALLFFTAGAVVAVAAAAAALLWFRRH